MANEAPPPSQLKIEDILDLLPHRYPFVLVDRVVEFEPKVRLVAEKLVTANEPFFRGHFPKKFLFPGVLQIEAAAQASALLVHLSHSEDLGLLVFGQVKRFTFLAPVEPGHRLQIEVFSKSFQGGQGLAEAKLSVEGELVAKGTLAYGSLGG